MRFWKKLLAVIILCFSASSNAVVINTLNGVTYEWLELTETMGMSRLDVQQELWNENSSLFGYEFASRSLVQELLRSYSGWDGVTGILGDSSVVAGMNRFLDDFGRNITPGDGYDRWITTSDGYRIGYDTINYIGGLYGDECSNLGSYGRSCLTNVVVYTSISGENTAATVTSWGGWDSENPNPLLASNEIRSDFGSHLVRISTVPIPAVVWLFGSGLIALVGFTKRKKI